MSKLRCILITTLILLTTLSSYAKPVPPKDFPKNSGNIIFALAMAEVDRWGAEDGIQDLTFIGNWTGLRGEVMKISKTDNGLLIHSEFGCNYSTDTLINIDKDTVRVDDEGDFRRCTDQPTFKTSGKYLATWMCKGIDGKETPLLAFTKNDSGITVCYPGDKNQASETKLWREDKFLMCRSPQSRPYATLTAAGPDAQPADESWKCLVEGSATNLTFMLLCTQCYAADHGGRLPPMQNSEQAMKALYPYMEAEGTFRQPGTGLPYKINTVLSGRKVSTIKDPAGTVLFYDPKPWPDGYHCAIFATGIIPGHGEIKVKILSNKEWQRVAKRNHLQ